ncbi:MAG TPA: FimV/HubP family polar landmark protein, partial [Burkholderiaceae bacterium]
VSGPTPAAAEPSATQAASTPATAAATTEPAATPPAPPPAPPRPKPAPVPPPPPEPSFIDNLLEEPMVPLAGGGILALLAGLGIYRVLKRKRAAAAPADSAFTESRLQPDSFFGASGGQRVDTRNESTTGSSSSSLQYSPSQLDAGGDVDPVAEADVYLAYGRDLQAEEILKEALRATPTRAAIHAKLAEIYAKRHDHKAFESIATEAFKLTQGEGPEWERIRKTGNELDPANALYQPGDKGAAAMAAAVQSSARPHLADTGMQLPSALSPSRFDKDLDIDLSLPSALDLPASAHPTSLQPAPVSAPAPLTPSAAIAPPVPAVKPPATAPAPLPSFSPVAATIPASLASVTNPMPLASHEASTPESGGLDFSFEDSSFDIQPTPPAPLPAAPSSPATPEAPKFDMSTISLELDRPTGPVSLPATLPASVTELADLTSDGSLSTAPTDPLATKLALAEEFNALGDVEGARALAKEVLAAATGDLRSKAQSLIASLV